MSNKVVICHSINENLADAISQCTYDKLFILVDEHTRKLCIPLIQEAGFMKDAQLICIGAEDVHKNLEHLGLCVETIRRPRSYTPFTACQPRRGMVTDWVVLQLNIQARH